MVIIIWCFVLGCAVSFCVAVFDHVLCCHVLVCALLFRMDFLVLNFALFCFSVLRCVEYVLFGAASLCFGRQNDEAFMSAATYYTNLYHLPLDSIFV